MFNSSCVHFFRPQPFKFGSLLSPVQFQAFQFRPSLFWTLYILLLLVINDLLVALDGQRLFLVDGIIIGGPEFLYLAGCSFTWVIVWTCLATLHCLIFLWYLNCLSIFRIPRHLFTFIIIRNLVIKSNLIFEFESAGNKSLMIHSMFVILWI